MLVIGNRLIYSVATFPMAGPVFGWENTANRVHVFSIHSQGNELPQLLNG